MTALRQQTVDLLQNSIPEESMQQVHDYLITLISIKDERPKKSHKAKGALRKYADPSKWSLEEGAFERATVENYAAD